MTALENGAALYARGEYFEAHEAWEELWLSLDGEPRLFVQGLIQVAAACHKAFVQDQPRLREAPGDRAGEAQSRAGGLHGSTNRAAAVGGVGDAAAGPALARGRD